MCGQIVGQGKEGVNYIISECSKFPLKGMQKIWWHGFGWKRATTLPVSILNRNRKHLSPRLIDLAGNFTIESQKRPKWTTPLNWEIQSTLFLRQTPSGPALLVGLREVSGLYTESRGNVAPVILKLDLFAINIDQEWSSLDFCLTCTKQLKLTWKWDYFLIVQSNVLKANAHGFVV